MVLKDYQTKALEKVEEALRLFDAKRKFMAAKELTEQEYNYAEKAFGELKNGQKYFDFRDSEGRIVPNFCLKVPTGGGKTLLAAHSLALACRSFSQKTGLCLWVVPSTTIYRQTLRQLKDRNSSIRLVLDAAFGRKVKVLEKTDPLTAFEVQSQMCVMLVTLQAFNIHKDSREARKIFHDSGAYMDFFPQEDDARAHRDLLANFPSLEKTESSWPLVLSSLINVIKLCRPIIIVDEKHRVNADQALESLSLLNPSLLIELTATPNKDKASVLVDIQGADLAREHMIKLPIHVTAVETNQWKDCVDTAVAKLRELEKAADGLKKQGGRYIRPMLLVRVENTGKKFENDAETIHSEHVRKYLRQRYGYTDEEVKIKTSEEDELREIDEAAGLLSPETRVKVVITKDALREGWDCPFAYALCTLTRQRG